MDKRNENENVSKPPQKWTDKGLSKEAWQQLFKFQAMPPTKESYLEEIPNQKRKVTKEWHNSDENITIITKISHKQKIAHNQETNQSSEERIINERLIVIDGSTTITFKNKMSAEKKTGEDLTGHQIIKVIDAQRGEDIQHEDILHESSGQIAQQGDFTDFTYTGFPPQDTYTGSTSQDYTGSTSQDYPGFPPQDYPGFPPQDYPGFPPQDYPGFPPQDYPGFTPQDTPLEMSLHLKELEYGQISKGVGELASNIGDHQTTMWQWVANLYTELQEMYPNLFFEPKDPKDALKQIKDQYNLEISYYNGLVNHYPFCTDSYSQTSLAQELAKSRERSSKLEGYIKAGNEYNQILENAEAVYQANEIYLKQLKQKIDFLRAQQQASQHSASANAASDIGGSSTQPQATKIDASFDPFNTVDPNNMGASYTEAKMKEMNIKLDDVLPRLDKLKKRKSKETEVPDNNTKYSEEAYNYMQENSAKEKRKKKKSTDSRTLSTDQINLKDNRPTANVISEIGESSTGPQATETETYTLEQKQQIIDKPENQAKLTEIEGIDMKELERQIDYLSRNSTGKGGNSSRTFREGAKEIVSCYRFFMNYIKFGKKSTNWKFETINKFDELKNKFESGKIKSVPIQNHCLKIFKNFTPPAGFNAFKFDNL